MLLRSTDLHVRVALRRSQQLSCKSASRVSKAKYPFGSVMIGVFYKAALSEVQQEEKYEPKD